VPKKPDKNQTNKTIRASVSFPASDYTELERIAAKKRVSLAWVVRDAVDQYLTQKIGLQKSGREE
jgi:hypothetical protein